MIGRRIKKSVELNPSLSLDQCLAKSYKTNEGNVIPGRLVFNHCLIVGKVAQALILRLPRWLRESLFPDGSDLIVASHDVGKVSPTFQKKIYAVLSQKDGAVLLTLKKFSPETERQWGGHAGVSLATV